MKATTESGGGVISTGLQNVNLEGFSLDLGFCNALIISIKATYEVTKFRGPL